MLKLPESKAEVYWKEEEFTGGDFIEFMGTGFFDDNFKPVLGKIFNALPLVVEKIVTADGKEIKGEAMLGWVKNANSIDAKELMIPLLNRGSEIVLGSKKK